MEVRNRSTLPGILAIPHSILLGLSMVIRGCLRIKPSQNNDSSIDLKILKLEKDVARKPRDEEVRLG
jgi:hypothetical protein